MKLLYIVTKGNTGGAQKYVSDLALFFAQVSSENKIIVAHGDGDALPRFLSSKGIETVALKHLHRDINLKEDRRAYQEILTLVRKIQPDIVHLNSPKASFLGSLAARKAKVKKIIMTVHGWPFKEKRGFLWRGTIYIASVITTLLCTNIIVISRKGYETTLRMPFSFKKTSLIYNGINETNVTPSKEVSRHTLIKKRFPNKKIWMVSISELNHNKNIGLAIDAISKLPKSIIEKTLYVIISDGELRTTLENKVKTLGLEDSIYFTGVVKNARAHLNAFDILLMPSIKEGLPYSLLEAGFSKVAVIASNLDGIREIITDKKTGLLFTPDDAVELSQLIKMLVEDEDARSLYGQCLLESVRDKFSFQQMTRRVNALYRSH